MNKAWRTKDVNVSMPASQARSMFERGRRYGRGEGGRFDARKATMFLWSGPVCAEDARPIASFSLRWGKPTINKAMIYRLRWDEANGGSLGEICHAIEVLAGQLVAR
jgi:hypothetical protein